jgi:hypothetical protein
MKFIYFFEFFPFLWTILAYLNPDSKHNLWFYKAVLRTRVWICGSGSCKLKYTIRILTLIFFYFQFNTSKLLPTSVISVPLHLTLR